MTPTIKDWIDNLRSGKFTQGMDYLKAKNREGEWCYCCLGVYCELFPDLQKVEKRQGYGFEKVIAIFGDGSFNKLPEVIAMELGSTTTGLFLITPDTPHYDKIKNCSRSGRQVDKVIPIKGGDPVEISYLTRLNDNVRLSFPEIADVIEHVSLHRHWLKEIYCHAS